jgi:hypothetical protein
VLHRLVKDADVFLTNFLLAARKLHIDVDDIRKVNATSRGRGKDANANVRLRAFRHSCHVCPASTARGDEHALRVGRHA